MTELPPLAIQIIESLRETYDHRGREVFDEDATLSFHAIGWIIARVCGREVLAKAIRELEAAVMKEGIGKPNAPTVH
jgi:hypothetical protein